MSEAVREFLTFAPRTLAGDWAWVTLSWLLAAGAFGGYWLYLRAKARRLNKEVPESTAK